MFTSQIKDFVVRKQHRDVKSLFKKVLIYHMCVESFEFLSRIYFVVSFSHTKAKYFVEKVKSQQENQNCVVH